MTASLYQIANDFAKLTDSDMPPEMIADTLDGIEWERKQRSSKYLPCAKTNSPMPKRLRKRLDDLSSEQKHLRVA